MGHKIPSDGDEEDDPTFNKVYAGINLAVIMGIVFLSVMKRLTDLSTTLLIVIIFTLVDIFYLIYDDESWWGWTLAILSLLTSVYVLILILF